MYLSWHQSVYVSGLPRWTRFCSTVHQHWPSVDPLFCNTTSLKLLLSSWLLAGIQQPICYVIRGTHSPKSFYNSKMGLFLLHVFYLSYVLASSIAEVTVENPQCWFSMTLLQVYNDKTQYHTMFLHVVLDPVSGSCLYQASRGMCSHLRSCWHSVNARVHLSGPTGFTQVESGYSSGVNLSFENTYYLSPIWIQFHSMTALIMSRMFRITTIIVNVHHYLV